MTGTGGVPSVSIEKAADFTARVASADFLTSSAPLGRAVVPSEAPPPLHAVTRKDAAITAVMRIRRADMGGS